MTRKEFIAHNLITRSASGRGYTMQDVIDMADDYENNYPNECPWVSTNVMTRDTRNTSC